MWWPSPPLPYYAKKFPISEFFWIRRRLPFDFLRHWDRIFLTENRVTAHLCTKIFGDPKLLIQWRFPHESFWHSETINYDKTVMHSSSAWNFSVLGTFSKHRRFPLRFFLAMWNKNKSTENLDAVTPFLHPIFFKNQKASETTKGSRMKFFSPVRQKVFEKSLILRPMHQKFLCQIFFESRKIPLPIFSVLWDTKKFSTELWCHNPHPALLWMTIFDTRSFLKCRCVPLRDLSLVWKNSSTVNDEILFWCIKFSISEFFWNTERFHYEFYRY